MGTGATLNAGDTINLLGGTDTLRISSGSATALTTGLTGVSISGIEIISMINPGNVVLDASALTGLTTFRVEDASAIGAQSITGVLGMNNVFLATANGANTAGTLTVASNAAETTMNLTLNGYQGATAAAPTALTLTGAGITTSNINSTTAANATAAFTGQASATAFNIAAATALTMGGAASAGATTVTITGAGNVTLGATNFAATVTVNASGSTGNISMTAEDTTTFTYVGSTGNDTLTFNATQLTNADSVNLGAGTNTLGIADTALGGTGTAALNTVVNGITTAQIIRVNGNTTVDMSGVTATILSLGAGNNVVTKIAATDKVIVNGLLTGTISATAALGFNTFNLELNGAAAVAATGALNVTNQASINILSATTATTTAGANTIGAVTNSANAVFTVTGANQLTVTSLSAAASFDASAATGIITVLGADAASIIKGGNKADVLTGATLAGGDTIDGGAGNDAIASAAVTGTVATVITGGLGADAIALNGATAVLKVYTINATAAQSFATTGQFDTVTLVDSAAQAAGSTITLVTGQLSSTVTGLAAANFVLGTTAVTAGSFLAVGSASATLTTTDQNFQIYQDSNSNAIIDATDLRVDFTDAATDTTAITIVAGQIVVVHTGVV